MSVSIVVLDGHALNPGDLSWDPLQQLGVVTVFPRTAVEEIVSNSLSADVLITNKVPLSGATLAALPRLRFIGVTATGHNVIDGVAARSRGIAVSNVPSYGTHAVAQHAFALLLELTQQVGALSQSVHAGRWAASPDWCYWDRPLIELSGLTLGIVGTGRIGCAVGAIGTAFGMTVRHVGRNDGRDALEALLRESDVVSLHCPLTAQTQYLINATTLTWMKPSAYLINTGRGALVDEHALADALRRGSLAGAGLDVLSVEPPPAANPLVGAPNLIVTPHVAWAATKARERLMAVTVENVRAFLRGQPTNVVN